jgi:hypothetical protein
MKSNTPHKNSNSISRFLVQMRLLNACGWKDRADWIVTQYVRSGDARHLVALTRHVKGIKQRFGVL